ncbi:uncharacterized protein IWZ02DRAFT_228930 [Phyllosticta citriasiana]|uniref:uncharacterized protein n=1 Tax=Phyllosticta citriasiana TaxID=595635 RepID=UPI0030FD21DA
MAASFGELRLHRRVPHRCCHCEQWHKNLPTLMHLRSSGFRDLTTKAFCGVKVEFCVVFDRRIRSRRIEKCLSLFFQTLSMHMAGWGAVGLSFENEKRIWGFGSARNFPLFFFFFFFHPSSSLCPLSSTRVMHS